MPDILITEELSSTELGALAEKHSVHMDPNLWRDQERLKELIRPARVVIVRHQTQLTAEVMRAAPALLGIVRWGVGLDNIDLEAASRLGIVVVAPLGSNAVSVAEFTMGLLLSLARRIPLADRATRAGCWDRRTCLGVEILGKTLAICGFGRVGRLVAARAHAFGARIVVYDPFVSPKLRELRQVKGTLSGSLEKVLADADFICIHCELTDRTRHMIGRQALLMTKPGAFLINTSRGGVIDEEALIESLRAGHLGGAALDVREVEPPAIRGELEAMDNVILTPHCAALTTESQARTLEAVVQDVEQILSGAPSSHFVNFAIPRRSRVDTGDRRRRNGA